MLKTHVCDPIKQSNNTLLPDKELLGAFTSGSWEESLQQALEHSSLERGCNEDQLTRDGLAHGGDSIQHFMFPAGKLRQKK